METTETNIVKHEFLNGQLAMVTIPFSLRNSNYWTTTTNTLAKSVNDDATRPSSAKSKRSHLDSVTTKPGCAFRNSIVTDRNVRPALIVSPTAASQGRPSNLQTHC